MMTRQSHEEEGWFPPIRMALEGVTAAQASWHPTGDASNSIWETARHMLYYKAWLLDLLQGGEGKRTLPNNDATFALNGDPGDEAAWTETVNELERVHQGFMEALSAFTDEDFDRLISNRPLGPTVTNVILHDAHHTGQIILLRKLQGSWPATRHFD